MASESENQGGCDMHGPFHVCGHSSKDCPDLKTETEGQGVLESPTLKQYEQALAFYKKDEERAISEPVKAYTPGELRQLQLDTVVAAETSDKVFLASHPLVDLEDNREEFQSIITWSPKGVNQTDLIEKFKESAGQRVAEVIGEKKSPERILSELKYDLQDLARKIERLSEKLKSLDRESTEAYGIENIQLPRLKEMLLKTEARLKKEEEKREGE